MAAKSAALARQHSNEHERKRMHVRPSRMESVKEASERSSHELAETMNAKSFSQRWPAITVAVSVAAGLGLFVASMVGVGEAAIAGAAGYLAYRRITGNRARV